MLVLSAFDPEALTHRAFFEAVRAERLSQLFPLVRAFFKAKVLAMCHI
jgi:hypothetical protein